MASQRAIAWVERAAWTLIYGGLFAVVLGLAEREADLTLSWLLCVCGMVVTLVGAFLIWLRSRMETQ